MTNTIREGKSLLGCSQRKDFSLQELNLEILDFAKTPFTP